MHERSFARNPDFAVETMQGEALIYKVPARKAIYLNETAAVVWELCDGTRTVKDITNFLVGEYPSASTAINGDVDEVISALLREGALVEKKGAPPRTGDTLFRYAKADCFYELAVKSTCRTKLLDFAKQNTDWLSATAANKYSFLQVVVPHDLIRDDPVLSNFSAIQKNIRILRMLPNTYYNLHVDGWRGSGVNLLLNDSCESTTFYNIGNFRRNQLCIEPLHYERDSYYLLNTQIEHAVINLDQDRYTLSVGLGATRSGHDPEDKVSVFREILCELKAKGL